MTIDVEGSRLCCFEARQPPETQAPPPGNAYSGSALSNRAGAGGAPADMTDYVLKLLENFANYRGALDGTIGEEVVKRYGYVNKLLQDNVKTAPPLKLAAERVSELDLPARAVSISTTKTAETALKALQDIVPGTLDQNSYKILSTALERSRMSVSDKAAVRAVLKGKISDSRVVLNSDGTVGREPGAIDNLHNPMPVNGQGEGYYKGKAHLGYETETNEKKYLFHYTDEKGLNGILKSKELLPSVKANNPKDARYGNGQYLSDIEPGTKTPAQLSRIFLNNPYLGKRFTHFLKIDVDGLNLVNGRKNVYLVRNEEPLALEKLVLDYGEVEKY